MIATKTTLIALIVTMIINIGLTIYLSKGKKNNQLKSIFIISLSILIFWTLGLIMQITLSKPLNIKPVYFDYFIYIAICTIPIAVFFMGLIYANTKIELRKRYLLLFVVPIISLIILWTNDFHHLFYEQYSTNISDTVYGPYMVIHNIYSYILLVFGIIYMLKFSIKNSGFFSKQSLLIVLGVSVPVVVNILGTFSHLCVADSNTKENIDFTNRQIELFNETIKRIKTKGYDTGKVHLQSSYGVINYTGLDYDYVRVGILMYGINSSYESYQLIHLNLKPVLSLKARITSVKEINKNDSVSYGRTYIATENRKIASVSIGYADGIPRNLSNQKMQVKINESYGTVIGRICMDQLLIDISDISNVKVGDIITIIGEDKNITAEQVADKAGTITNELLCRLGDRLARIIV